MAQTSKIEWTDATWNPVIGCSTCSPGCQNCYAERMAKRQVCMRPGCEYNSVIGEDGRWNERTRFLPLRLMQPGTWRKPRRVFVCSMGDLFHETVPFSVVDRVMAIAATTPRHTYQVLTKRPERMEEWFSGADERLWQETYRLCGKCRMDWPLSNVWIGTTVENQDQAELRIPHLLKCPAAVRFISVEPMLGQVDLTRVRFAATGAIENVLMEDVSDWARMAGIDAVNRVDWVICGGETGPHARPMHPQWVCSLRDQCTESHVPFFFKQWGEWVPQIHAPGDSLSRRTAEHALYVDLDGSTRPARFGSRRDAATVQKVGKLKSGSRILGMEYREFPEVSNAN